MNSKSSYVEYGSVVVMLMYLTGIVVINNFAKQDHFPIIAIGYSLSFGAYVLLLKYVRNPSLLWVAVFIAAFISTTSMPALSDDVYRFLWDGYLSYKGINPYAYTPIDYLAIDSDAVLTNWYGQLNSPNYYSVYPLVCQLIFYLSIFFSKWQLSPVMVMKFIYCIIHFGGLYFAMKWCKREGMNYERLLFYYLNPLVVVEGIGNLHAEVVMVALLIPGFYYLQQRRLVAAAIFMSLSIATKLIPLIFLHFCSFT